MRWSNQSLSESQIDHFGKDKLTTLGKSNWPLLESQIDHFWKVKLTTLGKANWSLLESQIDHFRKGKLITLGRSNWPLFTLIFSKFFSSTANQFLRLHQNIPRHNQRRKHRSELFGLQLPQRQSPQSHFRVYRKLPRLLQRSTKWNRFVSLDAP